MVLLNWHHCSTAWLLSPSAAVGKLLEFVEMSLYEWLVVMDTVQERINIDGPVGRLQGRLEYNSSPAFIGVVCHPHPLFGGTMDNKVVTTLCRAVRDGGGAALRFNFRGVGESQGVYGEGLGEAEDLLAAIHWMQSRFAGLPVWLAGFSFGSYVAAQVATSQAITAQAVVTQTDKDQLLTHLLLVAPPVHHFDFQSVTETRCPVTVVQGDDDEVVDAKEVHDWAQQSPLAPDLIRFPSCGHFFHGKLTELKALALNTLPGSGAALIAINESARYIACLFGV